MPSRIPRSKAWLASLPETPRSINSLVAEGFEGISIEDLRPWLRDGQALQRLEAISWLRTLADAEGEVAVMTADTEALGALLEWMLERRGICPMVYAADEDEVAVPDGLPALKPTAYNLPKGMDPEEVLTDELLNVLLQIFVDMKAVYGEQAHLLRMDLGCFLDHMERQGGVVLRGEFLDLNSREIHRFTMDSIAQRLRYESTGRFLSDTEHPEAEAS